MRSGRLRSMRREQARPAAVPGARARAERLWNETVVQPCAPMDGNCASNAAHLPLSPSPKGGGGTQTAIVSSPSPPFRTVGPDGATAPRAYARKRRAATRAEHTIERSERPAPEGREQVEERAGVRRGAFNLNPAVAGCGRPVFRVDFSP